MNIIELTRILNERYSELTKNLTPIADKLEKNAQKSGNGADAQDFLTRINNLLLKKVDELDDNSLYAQIRQRLKGFIGGSNQNDNNTLNDILSLLSNTMMEQILEQSSNTVLAVKSDKQGKKALQLASYFGYQKGSTKAMRDADEQTKQANTNINTFLMRMKDFKPGSAGPYEVLLCLLFNGSKVEKGSSDARGDIIIGDKTFEVKGHNGGCIDTGLDDLQLKMKTAKGSDMKKLMSDLNKAKQLFNVLDSKGTKLMEQFAKKLTIENRQKLETNLSKSMGRKNTMTTNDIENFFSLLSDEDKKRAVLYGFFNLGYKNLIICKPDAMFNTRLLFEEDIQSIIDGKTKLQNYGIDIKLSSQVVTDEEGVRAKTANFGSFIMQVI